MKMDAGQVGGGGGADDLRMPGGFAHRAGGRPHPAPPLAPPLDADTLHSCSLGSLQRIENKNK